MARRRPFFARKASTGTAVRLFASLPGAPGGWRCCVLHRDVERPRRCSRPCAGPALCRVVCPDPPHPSLRCALGAVQVSHALRARVTRWSLSGGARCRLRQIEGVLDPGHARAADNGRGAGAFRARIAAHTAPARRAARAPKASQPQGQTLNGTVRAMLGAAAGGALRLCRARTHGLGTPTRTARTAPNASRRARAQSLPTLKPELNGTVRTMLVAGARGALGLCCAVHARTRHAH